MDSLLDLNPANQTIMDMPPNWSVAPGIKREILVTSNLYPGTIQSVEFYREPINRPHYKITDLETRLYPFLVFFADRVARQKSFWLPDVFQRFIPTAIENSGFDLIIEKLPNLALHGHERIFIRTKSGDRYTRKIESITQQTTTTKLTLASQILGIVATDIEFCSLIYYVRFDMDVLDIEYVTDKVASVEVSFVELFAEYDNWGGA